MSILRIAGPSVMAVGVALAAGCGGAAAGAEEATQHVEQHAATHAIKTVFLILLENENLSSIQGSASAPYLNSLLAVGAHAANYYNPPNLHPSEPNYIWLEAGDNLGITDDNDPSSHHLTTTDHLVTQLERAGVTWKSYQEDISGTECPVTSSGLYAAKHDPMVFFDDVTDGNSPTAARCIAHVRPYSELTTDLISGKVAQYNFITPNLCDDMHGAFPQCIPVLSDNVKKSDTWLSAELPKIMASNAYKDGGVIFVTWDESEGGNYPIGFIALSPLAKPGYMSTIAYTHSSTLKTIETIFGVPLLRDAANPATPDLRDLFQTFP